jgi:solute carrier family 25 protein 38
MEAYPPAYVEHNLPFIVLSGLGSQDELEPPPSVHSVLPGRAAVRTSSEIPPVTGERADQLLQDFLSADGTNAPWNARGSSRRDLAHSFRIRAVGRVCMSPCVARS